jgi:hypothetical protein
MYAIVGAIAGFISGLLGIGGSIVLVPVLYAIFLRTLGVDMAMHLAIGTSMCAVVVNLAVGIFSHFKHQSGRDLFVIIKKLSLAIVLGGIAGAALTSLLSAQKLKYIFAFFLMALILKLIFIKKSSPQDIFLMQKTNIPMNFITHSLVFFIGFVSALLGLGGGVLMVPFFQHYRIPMQQCAALATGLGFALSVVTSIAYLSMGHNITTPAGATGYIYWPAFFPLVIFGALCSPLGTKLARKLSDSQLRYTFVFLLTVIALKMIFL